MTVSELIQALKAMPQDAPVWMETSSGNGIHPATAISPSTELFGEIIIISDDPF
jgi:hypothetical protein